MQIAEKVQLIKLLRNPQSFFLWTAITNHGVFVLLFECKLNIYKWGKENERLENYESFVKADIFHSSLGVCVCWLPATLLCPGSV